MKNSGTISPEERQRQFDELLCRLNLQDNYLDKLTAADFLNIGQSVKKPCEITESDLAHTFIQKLLVLDHRCRYIPVMSPSLTLDGTQEDFDREECFFDVFDSANVDTDQSHIHPMDVQMAVFHCSDSFLR